MVSIVDERTKLLANSLDRASTACFTLGVLGPLAAALFGIPAGFPVSTPKLVLGAATWFTAAVALHLIARWVLGRLTQ